MSEPSWDEVVEAVVMLAARQSERLMCSLEDALWSVSTRLHHEAEDRIFGYLIRAEIVKPTDIPITPPPPIV